MPFKDTWEKVSSEKQLPKEVLEQMVQSAFPGKRLQNYDVFAGGCANLNVKVQLAGDEQPLILRVYVRDRDACDRERLLGELLRAKVPVPKTYRMGEVDGYHFAFTQLMMGISLRSLLLSDTPHDLGSVMYDVGLVLSRIAAHEFPAAGFFDKDLRVVDAASSAELLDFARSVWANEVVVSVLGLERISKIKSYIEEYGFLLPGDGERRLVHGDFDPANILVDRIDGEWRVSAVLDWEFAFSGSLLWDVANMLRYAHTMPPEFTREFINGLTSNGIVLPDQWEITVTLLNLMSLSDCLARSTPERHPNTCADICELIDDILGRLGGVSG